jgi:hypothetical protein
MLNRLLQLVGIPTPPKRADNATGMAMHGPHTRHLNVHVGGFEGPGRPTGAASEALSSDDR